MILLSAAAKRLITVTGNSHTNLYGERRNRESLPIICPSARHEIIQPRWAILAFEGRAAKFLHVKLAITTERDNRLLKFSCIRRFRTL